MRKTIQTGITAALSAAALTATVWGAGSTAAAPYVQNVSDVTASASADGETITVTLINSIPAGFAPVACNYGFWPAGVTPTPGGGPQAIPGTVRSAVVMTSATDVQTVTLPPGDYDLHFECVAEIVADNAAFDNLTTGPFFWGTQAVLDSNGWAGTGHPVVGVTTTEPAPEPEPEPEPEPACFGSVCLP